MINIPIQLELKLTPDGSITPYSGSLLHGFLMQTIDTEYATILHKDSLRPYSQYLIKAEDCPVWTVSATTKEAEQAIIMPLLDSDLTSVYLEHKDKEYEITEKTLTSCSYSELFRQSYLDENLSRFITIQLITPTSFKSGGQYVNFPDIRLIFGSLIKKYNHASPDTFIPPEESLEELVQASEISRYSLRSCSFPVDGAKVKAFIGSITFCIHGTPQLVSLANMLLKFGCYCGIGIKTALGMGAMKIIERAKDNE